MFIPELSFKTASENQQPNNYFNIAIVQIKKTGVSEINYKPNIDQVESERGRMKGYGK